MCMYEGMDVRYVCVWCACMCVVCVCVKEKR